MRTVAQKHRMIWGGFAILLTGAVASGYVPDLMLAHAMRGARAEGLLALPPATKVAKDKDARSLYEWAGQKYSQAPVLLGGEFAKQVKAPAPHVVKYLRAVASASARPECSKIGDGWSSSREYGGVEISTLYVAAKAMVARADGEAGLLPAARVARHVANQGGARPMGYWAGLVLSTLDRGAKLGLDGGAKRRVAAAFGPSVAPREALRRHFANMVSEYEKETQEYGARVSRTRDEAAYVRFWRGFFGRAPAGGEAFIDSVRRSEVEIGRAETQSVGYTDLSGIVVGTTPWTSWAIRLDQADKRLAALR